MLNTWLTDDTIQIRDSGDTWQEVVRLSAQPLLQKGIITPDYLKPLFISNMKSWAPIMSWLRVLRCHTQGQKKVLSL